MDKLDNIDNLFAKLGDDEKQAPSGAWEYILADQKRKRRAGLIWWYYGSVGLLLIAGLMGYYQFKSDNTTLQSNNTTQEKVWAKDANTSNNITSNKNLIETTGTPRKTLANIVVAPYTTNKTSRPVNNPYNDMAENTASIAVVEPDKEAEQPRANVTEEEVLITEVPVDKKTIDQTKEDKEKAIRKNPPVKIQKWFVEPVVMGTYSFRKLKGGADMADYISQRNNSEIRLLKLGAGINVGYSLNKNWNVQSGLLYNIQGLSASYTVSTAQKKVFVEVDPTMKKYDTTASYIYIKDSVYKLEKGNAINGDQKFHYIRIPVLFEWQTNIKKTAFIFYAGGGMSVNILLAARGDIQDYQSMQSGVFIPINQVSVQRIGIDMMGRCGWLLPILGRPDLKISGGIRGMYSPISAFSKEVPIKQHNFSVGVEVGIRKLLK